jgi:predicted helicase
MIVDNKHNWLVEALNSDFATFLPIGDKATKTAHTDRTSALFKTYSRGAETTRDNWMYDFDKNHLVSKAKGMIETYNGELSRWIRAGSPKDVDNFVLSDETKIKWSSRLKECLMRKIEARFKDSSVRKALYRPFTSKWLYFDSVMTHRQGMFPRIFPSAVSEQENKVIVLSDHGSRTLFSTFATNIIPDLHLLAAIDAFQCFPYYTYAENGSNRRENITDWALEQFQARYGEGVSKWDIFHYVYAMLHHPQYRECYAENLKRDLPHIPLLQWTEAYQAAVRIGQALIELHVNYEQQEPYSLTQQEDPLVPFGQLYIVEKMKLTPDRAAVIVNKGLTLADIPKECFRYRLGNRSALEWVIDQYQVGKDARSRITSDPNRLDDPEYIVRLVKQIVTVSVKTVGQINELAQVITQDDWMGEIVASEK